MPRASETITGSKISCPQPCGGTLAVDGKIKCRRCKKEHTLEELLALRLGQGSLCWKDVVAACGSRFPFGLDTEYHRAIRGVFGKKFFGFPESEFLCQQSKNNLDWGALWDKNIVIGQYANPEVVGIPYDLSTLTSEAAKGSWFMLAGRKTAREIARTPAFCRCHNQEIYETVLGDSCISDAGWMLFRSMGYPCERHMRLANVAEAMFLFAFATSRGLTLVPAHHFECAYGPAALTGIRVTLQICPVDRRKYYVAFRERFMRGYDPTTSYVMRHR